MSAELLGISAGGVVAAMSERIECIKRSSEAHLCICINTYGLYLYGFLVLFRVFFILPFPFERGGLIPTTITAC